MSTYIYHRSVSQDGGWDSMIRQLEDREVMLGAAAFAITDNRRKVGRCHGCFWCKQLQ